MTFRTTKIYIMRTKEYTNITFLIEHINPIHRCKELWEQNKGE